MPVILCLQDDHFSPCRLKSAENWETLFSILLMPQVDKQNTLRRMDETVLPCFRAFVYMCAQSRTHSWRLAGAHACPTVCICAVMVFDGCLYCIEPLKAPSFLLSEFSCQQVILDQQFHQKYKVCNVF